MKILLLTWACDRDDVSEPAIAYRWVSEIAKRHEVVLFAVSRPERFGCVREQFPDLHVIEWKDICVPTQLERFRAIVKPGYFSYFFKARKFLRELVQQHDFDIIHHLNPFTWRYATPAYGLGVPLIRGPLAGGLPTPKALSSVVQEMIHPYKFLRYTDDMRKRYDPILRTSFLHTDCVIAAAPYVLELLKPLPVGKVEIEIEHGLEYPPLFQSQSNNAPEKKILDLLFVGRVVRTKGAQDAIRAISHMRQKHMVKLTIIGDGEDMGACLKLAESLQLGDIVEFCGWCTNERVKQAYQHADIFVFPSFREPTGGVLLEAMSYGLPCVTCDYGGPSAIITKKNGMLVPPAPPEEYARNIATALDTLVVNPNLRKCIAANAHSTILEKFVWEKKITRIEKYYRNICDQKKR